MRYQKLSIAGPKGRGTYLKHNYSGERSHYLHGNTHIALDFLKVLYFFSWLVLRTQNPSKSLKKPLLTQKDDNILPQER